LAFAGVAFAGALAGCGRSAPTAPASPADTDTGAMCDRLNDWYAARLEEGEPLDGATVAQMATILRPYAAGGVWTDLETVRTWAAGHGAGGAPPGEVVDANGRVMGWLDQTCFGGRVSRLADDGGGLAP
jgi:hypothetical protein